MLMVDFSSEKEVDEWLTREPYITGKVWETVEIHKCSTRDPWQFNRSEEFFRSKQ